MSDHDFHQYAIEYLESIQAETGLWLDQHFTGQRVAEALHLEISPAVAAIMRTEMALGKRVAAGTKVRFDLKELDQVSPPAHEDNLFVTFLISSLSDPDGESLAFALHFTRLAAGAELAGSLLPHVFRKDARLDEAYSVIVYALTSGGEMRLGTTRVVIGLGTEGELVAYRTVGLGAEIGENNSVNPPSDQMMFLLFLALSAFMMVNQGEAPILWTGDGKAKIG